MTEDSQNIQMKKEIPVSFFMDEVRCGFVIPAAIKQAWAAELTVLQEIDRVCRKHHITYYADWGTLLGCIRHGGFVPWDDDIDIVMKREDYIRFLTVAVPDMEEGYAVQTYRNQKDFWLFMGKVVGKNHFCFEKEHLRKFHNFSYIACVDIFVLDYMYRDPEKEEKRRTLCKYMIGTADAVVEGRSDKEETEKRLRIIEEMCGETLERIEDPEAMGRYLYGKVEEQFGAVPAGESDRLVQLFPWGLKGNTNGYAREDYDPPIYLPFEYTEIPVPRLYDKMLRERYGDYLRLVKNAGAHDYPFFEGQKKNLQKVLDFPLPAFRFNKDKLQRTKEEKEYKAHSYKAMAEECLQEIGKLEEATKTVISNGQTNQAREHIAACQQLAVDLGTMLEQILPLYQPMVKKLEQYCEELYHLYEGMGTGDFESNNHLTQIRNDIEKEWEGRYRNRKTVLFLASWYEDWKAIEGLWKEKREDPDCDPYLVVLPYYTKDYDGSPRQWYLEEEQFTVEKQRRIEAKDLTLEYLELLHPEQIIIQNPYDGWHPTIGISPVFYAENIRKYTDELIYVSPFGKGDIEGKDTREYQNMQYYVAAPGVMYADIVMVSSEKKKKFYIEKLTEIAGSDTCDVWEHKILVRNREEIKEPGNQTVKEAAKKTHKKRLLYGISLGTYLEDPDKMLRKIQANKEIFQEYKDQLEFRYYLFPEGDWDHYAAEKDKVQNCIGTDYRIDVIGDYSLKDVDAYYGDPMPMAMKAVEDKISVMIQNYEI